MKSSIIIGTRGSKLALAQTNIVIGELKKIYPCLNIEIKIIKTTGDKILDTELSKIGGKGLFIKEIEEALSKNEIDIAIHSLKDVPHTLSDEFEFGAILKREDPRDVIITRHNNGLNGVISGALVGTSSLRRIIQLNKLRPDLNIKPMRGNIDTRINKLFNKDYDAIILAAAGIKRLMNENSELLKNLFFQYLEIKDFVPAVGQGAIAIEIRKNDNRIFDIIKMLNNDIDSKCVYAERAFLRELNGGCDIPVGAFCTVLEDNMILMTGFITNNEQNMIFKSSLKANINNYEKLGIKLANQLISEVP